jgi:hypothetical protein
VSVDHKPTAQSEIERVKYLPLTQEGRGRHHQRESIGTASRYEGFGRSRAEGRRRIQRSGHRVVRNYGEDAVSNHRQRRTVGRLRGPEGSGSVQIGRAVQHYGHHSRQIRQDERQQG